MRQVVKTVRISDTTIRKRLEDFRETPSSQLTIDEFQTIDLEEEQDPPSFTQGRKRAKQQAEELNKPEITSELKAFQRSIEKILGIDMAKDMITTEGGHKCGQDDHIKHLNTTIENGFPGVAGTHLIENTTSVCSISEQENRLPNSDLPEGENPLSRVDCFIVLQTLSIFILRSNVQGLVGLFLLCSQAKHSAVNYAVNKREPARCWVTNRQTFTGM